MKQRTIPHGRDDTPASRKLSYKKTRSFVFFLSSRLGRRRLRLLDSIKSTNACFLGWRWASDLNRAVRGKEMGPTCLLIMALLDSSQLLFRRSQLGQVAENYLHIDLLYRVSFLNLPFFSLQIRTKSPSAWRGSSLRRAPFNEHSAKHQPDYYTRGSDVTADLDGRESCHQKMTAVILRLSIVSWSEPGHPSRIAS